MNVADVIVVGTGPSGAQAAAVCADRGKRVTILDVAYDDEETRGSIPPGNFAALRRTDAGQARYFIGDADAAAEVARVRVGAQLTPPRQFITRGTDELVPLESSSFSPMQSLALGGLGAGWGAGTYNFDDAELASIGLPVDAMRRCYDDVAADIGVAAAPDDDTSDDLARFRPLQPPHELDSNCARVFAAYQRNRNRLRAAGLALGRAPGAVLSSEIERRGIVRAANPYEDMDFYSDASRSVYRPRFTVEGLVKRDNVRLEQSRLVTSVVPVAGGVEVHVRNLASGEAETFRAGRVILAAGAINTSRIVLRSLGWYDRPVPILSNPYTYLPCVNLAMFGRAASDRRHSLAQLSGVYRDSAFPGDGIILSLFSYRSLLLFKLVKEMPLDPRFGLLLARLLVSSLTIVGVHHPDRRTPEKSMTLRRRGGDDVLRIDYAQSNEERGAVEESLDRLSRLLRGLSLVTLRRINPGHGSSIHYAGALTVSSDRGDRLATAENGELYAIPGTYVADSANWRFLPAKGLTMTLMANGRRVAGAVCEALADG